MGGAFWLDGMQNHVESIVMQCGPPQTNHVTSSHLKPTDRSTYLLEDGCEDRYTEGVTNHVAKSCATRGAVTCRTMLYATSTPRVCVYVLYVYGSIQEGVHAVQD